MAAQQQWQPNNNGSPTTMAAQQQWQIDDNGGLMAMAAWSSIERCL
jgi:hypothetical protein